MLVIKKVLEDLGCSEAVQLADDNILFVRKSDGRITYAKDIDKLSDYRRAGDIKEVYYGNGCHGSEYYFI